MRVYENRGQQPEGFEPVPPTLEDAYFVAMRFELPAERESLAVGA